MSAHVRSDAGKSESIGMSFDKKIRCASGMVHQNRGQRARHAAGVQSAQKHMQTYAQHLSQLEIACYT